MENKKVFIGNLDFDVTENEIKNLLSKYGTVVSIKMHQKKGYAFVEMSDAQDATKTVQKINGTKYKDREIRASLELKAGKAKSLSVKKYKERGESFSRENSGGKSDIRSRSEKYRDQIKSGPNAGGKYKPAGSTYGKPGEEYRSKGRSSEFEDRSSGDYKKERPGLPRPERDRWSTERPDNPVRPARKVFSGEKPSYNSRPSRDDSKGNYNRSPRPESNYRSDERPSSNGNRPVKDYTKENSRPPRSPKREWTPEKPSYSGRPARDGEKTFSPKNTKREWSSEKPSGSSGRTNDSWKERSDKKEFSSDKPRDYSKPRSVSGSQNRFSKTTRPKSGDSVRRGPSGSSRPKPRSGSRDRDRSSRPKRD